jgi:divalent metal cation (Fe/Co/Zn/Cd) transporter
MSERKHFISIWLFIGTLLLIYGVLILASGIYDLFYPPAHQTVLANLHAQIWWGAVLLVLGVVYTWTFRPGKQK